MDLTLRQFANLLVRGRLLSSDEVKSLHARWKKESAGEATAAAFGRWLVDQGHLTQQQLTRLLEPADRFPAREHQPAKTAGKPAEPREVVQAEGGVSRWIWLGPATGGAVVAVAVVAVLMVRGKSTPPQASPLPVAQAPVTREAPVSTPSPAPIDPRPPEKTEVTPPVKVDQPPKEVESPPAPPKPPVVTPAPTPESPPPEPPKPPKSALAKEDGFVGDTLRPFVAKHCLGCHNSDTRKGNLDLETLPSRLDDPAVFTAWVKVHDRVATGEMPPRKKLPREEADVLVNGLDALLVAADRKASGSEGRSPLRRLNRTEYEYTLQDLLHMPGLGLRSILPEDGQVEGYDRCGPGLDISRVHLAKYVEAADFALDHAIAGFTKEFKVKVRSTPGEERDFTQVLNEGQAVFLKNGKPLPDSVPLLSKAWGPGPKFDEFLKAKGLWMIKSSVGLFRWQENHFDGEFRQPLPKVPGRYRVRLSVWGFRWDKGQLQGIAHPQAAGLRTSRGKYLGTFEAPSLKPTVHEVESWLEAGELIRVNAASIWDYTNRRENRSEKYEGPGLAIDWVEIDGPINDAWPPASHRALFGKLPLVPFPPAGPVPPPVPLPRREPPLRTPAQDYVFASIGGNQAAKDIDKLLAGFLRRAFRRPVAADEIARYSKIARQTLTSKGADRGGMEQAMRDAYRAALCSPDFLFLPAAADPLDDDTLASRLSYFLWNSMPDEKLSTLAREKRLHDPKVLRSECERLLADRKAERFRNDFLDQWLDLRDIDATSPDWLLYPEFNSYLRDSMVGETRAFFRELLDRDLPAANVVDSDFAMLNDAMAEHYRIPDVHGVGFRRVPLAPGSHRGGLLTQASVLKVTANGTVTSPVKRGAWVMRKIVGKPPDPPPANIAAVEPDTRGLTTIRDQLAQHRNQAACAGCHSLIDPPGFALESFDVIGGWRQQYRSIGNGQPLTREVRQKLGVNPVAWVPYRLGPGVDPGGAIAPGRDFRNIDEFKKLLLDDPRQIARNLTAQLVVYATGAPVRYADRAAIEQILDRAAPGNYGVRTLILEIVQSPLFLKR